MKNIRLAGLAGAVAASLFAQSALAYQVENFIDYYLIERGNLGNWNLTLNQAPGAAFFPFPKAGGGQQIGLQGSSSSSVVADPGYVELWTVVPQRGPGAGDVVSFQWSFATENVAAPASGPGDRVEFFYGRSYAELDRTIVSLADNRNGFGSYSQTIPLDATVIGWRVYSDNDQVADVFTVGAFTAPVPEPGTLLISGLFMAVGGFFYHQRRKKA
jgi:hypothetical protein